MGKDKKRDLKRMCKDGDVDPTFHNYFIGVNFKSIFASSFKQFFFYFLVYGSSDPNFCILEEKIIFDFFYFFLRCKKLPDLKKKN